MPLTPAQLNALAAGSLPIHAVLPTLQADGAWLTQEAAKVASARVPLATMNAVVNALPSNWSYGAVSLLHFASDVNAVHAPLVAFFALPNMWTDLAQRVASMLAAQARGIPFWQSAALSSADVTFAHNAALAFGSFGSSAFTGPLATLKANIVPNVNYQVAAQQADYNALTAGGNAAASLATDASRMQAMVPVLQLMLAQQAPPATVTTAKPKVGAVAPVVVASSPWPWVALAGAVVAGGWWFVESSRASAKAKTAGRR